jgi:hypothetical protein
VDEEKPGIYLWMTKSLEITSRCRRAWLSSLDEGKPGTYLWKKKSLELTSG